MEKAFIYGKSVGGDNFTDRIRETKRLKLNFENGMNTILISPRRMGKTSLVKKVMAEMNAPSVMPVYMDIYDCRSEYDFLNRFASVLMREPMSEVSLSLGITPKEYQPEEILNLPEIIAKEKGIHFVVCIDEFQQIGELPDALTVQKRMRGVWQHQEHVSYCLFGSKKHLMTNLFQNKRMPFYQFGEMMYLDCIPTADWVQYITSRFEKYGKHLSEEMAERICKTVDNYSSYVQQLSWNLLAETNGTATEDDFKNAVDALIAQCSGLFVQQTLGLTTYQLNFIRALCSGIHTDFGSKEINAQFPLGTKSNIARIKNALTEKELIEERIDGTYLSDIVFEMWFNREFM